jgi:hypothetical protein
MRILTLCFIMLILLMSCGQIEDASAIRAEQVDNFENNSPKGWSSGNPNPNAPANVENGGPEGDDDRFLQITSSGVQGGKGTKKGAGSKLVALNRIQWTGDYIAAGITTISVQMRYIGGEPENLYMRVAFRGLNDTWFSSTNHVVLPKGKGWQTVTFPIRETDLIRTNGIDSYTDVLSNVKELRILSRQETPGHQGDSIGATLGLDNITARTAESKLITTWSTVKRKK